VHNGELESAPFNYRRPTDIFSKESAMQRIPRVDLGQPHMKVLVQSKSSALAKKPSQARSPSDGS